MRPKARLIDRGRQPADAGESGGAAAAKATCVAGVDAAERVDGKRALPRPSCEAQRTQGACVRMARRGKNGRKQDGVHAASCRQPNSQGRMRRRGDHPVAATHPPPAVQAVADRRFRQMQTASADSEGEPPVARNQHTDTPGPAQRRDSLRQHRQAGAGPLAQDNGAARGESQDSGFGIGQPDGVRHQDEAGQRSRKLPRRNSWGARPARLNYSHCTACCWLSPRFVCWWR